MKHPPWWCGQADPPSYSISQPGKPSGHRPEKEEGIPGARGERPRPGGRGRLPRGFGDCGVLADRSGSLMGDAPSLGGSLALQDLDGRLVNCNGPASELHHEVDLQPQKGCNESRRNDMVSYEELLDRDVDWALMEGSMHFEGES